MRDWQRRLRFPSPAMVVACIALAVALSGTGYAVVVLPKNSVGTKQLRANAVKSKKIAPDAVKGVDVDEASLRQVPSALNALNAQNAVQAGNAARLGGLDPAAFGTQRWAVVNANGSLARSSGGVAAEREDSGIYYVDFGTPVDACAWTAALGDAGIHSGGKGGISTGIRSVLVSIDPVPVYEPVADTIAVTTFSGSTAVDLPFHLAVYC